MIVVPLRISSYKNIVQYYFQNSPLLHSGRIIPQHIQKNVQRIKKNTNNQNNNKYLIIKHFYQNKRRGVIVNKILSHWC